MRSGRLPLERLNVDFDKEVWAAKGVPYRTPTLNRLTREVMTSEHLVSFACSQFLQGPRAPKPPAALAAASAASPPPPPPFNVVSLALEAALTTPPPPFPSLVSKLISALGKADAFPVLTDAPTEVLGGSGYTISSALSLLDSASRAPSTVSPG